MRLENAEPVSVKCAFSLQPRRQRTVTSAPEGSGAGVRRRTRRPRGCSASRSGGARGAIAGLGRVVPAGPLGVCVADGVGGGGGGGGAGGAGGGPAGAGGGGAISWSAQRSSGSRSTASLGSEPVDGSR